MNLAAVALPLTLSGIADAAPPRTPDLSIRVTGDSAAAPVPIRAILSGWDEGTARVIVSSEPAPGDTVQFLGPVQVHTGKSVAAATFISDLPGACLHAVVRETDRRTMEASGEMIVVIRTPEGAKVQAMNVPEALKTRR